MKKILLVALIIIWFGLAFGIDEFPIFGNSLPNGTNEFADPPHSVSYTANSNTASFQFIHDKDQFD